MLRRICGRCNEVIDGDPVLDKEVPDMTLLFEEEVVLMYDDLCDKCRVKLRAALEDFLAEREVPEAPKEIEPPAEPAVEQPAAEEPPVPQKPVEAQVKQEPAKKPSLENLPNAVTKQFPIKQRQANKS